MLCKGIMRRSTTLSIILLSVNFWKINYPTQRLTLCFLHELEEKETKYGPSELPRCRVDDVQNPLEMRPQNFRTIFGMLREAFIELLSMTEPQMRTERDERSGNLMPIHLLCIYLLSIYLPAMLVWSRSFVTVGCLCLQQNLEESVVCRMSPFVAVRRMSSVVPW